MARIRREATRDLRESEQRFRNMADHAPVMMWVTDASGALTISTAAVVRIHRADAGSRPWALAPGMRCIPRIAARSQRIFFAANAAREAFRIEYRLRRARRRLSLGVERGRRHASATMASSSAISARSSTSPIARKPSRSCAEPTKLLEQRVAAAMAERAETEAQLRQAQKMEAVGKLTGGVAHDFNNVLQVISGNLQLLARDVAGNPRAEQRLQTAMAARSRAARNSPSQLLAFGRRQPLAPKVVNLGRLIRNIDDMLRRALGEGIEIETMIAGGLWNTFVDTAQVENALLNLAINARDAMNGHGKLTIEAGNAYLDDDYAARHAEVAAGPIRDAGGDRHRLRHAARDARAASSSRSSRPSRRARAPGSACSMVYGFVKQSGGHIKIYSELGHGTTVIYLPRARRAGGQEVEHEVRTPGRGHRDGAGGRG